MKARRAAEINMEEDIQSILREVEMHLRRLEDEDVFVLAVGRNPLPSFDEASLVDTMHPLFGKAVYQTNMETSVWSPNGLMYKTCDLFPYRGEGACTFLEGKEYHV